MVDVPLSHAIDVSEHITVVFAPPNPRDEADADVLRARCAFPTRDGAREYAEAELGLTEDEYRLEGMALFEDVEVARDR